MSQASENAVHVSIRLAAAADAIALAKLRYAFRSSMAETTEDEASFVPRCARWMKERLENTNGWRCWIAERGDLPVGNLWAQLIEKVPNPTAESEYHAYITNLYVDEACRGQGVGSLLLNAALGWIQTNDVHAVILWPTERSRSLYRRHKFTAADDLMELLL